MSKHGMKGPTGGGPIGKMAMGGEKPKDFKKTMKNLIKYLHFGDFPSGSAF